jgi:mono/diheme cytochrome c family protein
MSLDNKKNIFTLSIGLVLISLIALAEDESQHPALGDVSHGSKLYQTHCTACHGFDGKGLFADYKIKPADFTDGALMNARDDKMIFRTIQLGCQSSGCKGYMPGFNRELDKLDIWDLIVYLRRFHLPLRKFFPIADQFLVKSYDLGKVGNKDFQTGQIGRLKKVLKKYDSKELLQTTFTLFKADTEKRSLELVSQSPKELAKLKKKNKVGYVFFTKIQGPGNDFIPVGLALDTNYSIAKLIAPQSSDQVNKLLGKYIGMGKRGDLPIFATGKDKTSRSFDKIITRLYMLSVEAANAYEFEERERSWADGTF